MFEGLSDKLERSFRILKGQGHITEINVAETLKEVRKALLDADVSYKIAKDFADQVKQEALGQKILTAVSPGQLMVKIVHDKLVELISLPCVLTHSGDSPVGDHRAAAVHELLDLLQRRIAQHRCVRQHETSIAVLPDLDRAV